MKGESDLQLSGDEVEQGQPLEQKGESSEEDIPAFEESESGQNNGTPEILCEGFEVVWCGFSTATLDLKSLGILISRKHTHT